MSTISLIMASSLIAIPILISHREKLGLGKEIIISILRAIIQLVIVGYILDTIFKLDNKIVIIVLIFVMSINASLNTVKRGENINNVFLISLISIFTGSIITMSVLIFSGVIKFTSSEVIPIAGMIISNSMVAVGLSYRNLNTSFSLRRAEVETKLSLGASVKESSKEILSESIKIAIIPTIDSAKMLGIVSLPGMMTGLILGGVSPIMAVKFQIMVTFMIISSASISILISAYLSYKSFYNKRCQLV
ncbi:ABC transporter permease [[Clostridium] dakarense]|uniref:ABC transporter permease n=1 Tax=Faecalimicrobium dakarense TaxID=1301100 RepID=UPI0004B9AAA2|nr:iron export ABC transporter permease subunit FetB [[Clostridium] dakarense]